MRWLVVCLVAIGCGRHGGDDTIGGDDTHEVPDAGGPSCVDGEACTPDLACHDGATVCEAGTATCHATTALADGTACGNSYECANGECVAPCEPGLARCGGRCVDLQTDEQHCGECGTTCDANATCDAGTCKPGAPLAATGACTQIDQPGWLSCPTGMSCQCYYHYDKIFVDKPASLSTWLAPTSLQVMGGVLPQNQVMSSAPPATVALTANTSGVFAGAAYPYTVTVTAGVAEIKLHGSAGYVPPKFVLQTSADCGNRGQILDCTFH